jgi:hypothetical protein
MEKKSNYKIIMIAGVLITLIAILGLFLAYSIIYIVLIFAGVIVFNYGYSKSIQSQTN